MATFQGVYKCNVCGNIVQINHSGGGTLVCCGQPMELQQANTVDASLEKHVPVIEKTARGVLVKVGSEPHPMEETHFIEWIEILIGDKSYRQFLQPGQAPEAEFCVEGNEIEARIYCNLHGLWSSKL